jgi:hypothetical protein
MNATPTGVEVRHLGDGQPTAADRGLGPRRRASAAPEPPVAHTGQLVPGIATQMLGEQTFVLTAVPRGASGTMPELQEEGCHDCAESDQIGRERRCRHRPHPAAVRHRDQAGSIQSTSVAGRVPRSEPADDRRAR